jgi:hypothetical protein
MVRNPTIEDFRHFAAECRRFAIRCNDPKDRAALKLQAQAWDQVVEEHERKAAAG